MKWGRKEIQNEMNMLMNTVWNWDADEYSMKKDANERGMKNIEMNMVWNENANELMYEYAREYGMKWGKNEYGMNMVANEDYNRCGVK